MMIKKCLSQFVEEHHFLQLQDDEVQTHYSSTISDALNETFPGQWMRTESLITMLI
jgi:hypothetical protein